MNRARDTTRRNWIRFAVAVVGLVVFMAVYIEDWGRDFTEYEAVLSIEQVDQALEHAFRERPVEQLVDGIKMAAGRIKNWQYVGEAADGNTTLVYFVRQSRLLRLRDDVILRVEDLEIRRTISGTSRARTHLGDLGRNPRNLRRLLSELTIVLDGAVHRTGVAPREQG
jgi:hypothetical protein